MRRNLAGISVLLIFLLDIIANYGFFVIGAGIAITMLFWRSRSLWIATVVVLLMALAESVWLVAADFGGIPNLPLLLVRGFALIVVLTDDVRRQFY
jgi:hypothetical protein